MVVAAVAVVFDAAAWPRMQVTAVCELSAVENEKARVSDVEYNRLRFGIIRILDEFKGHDVVAL